MDKLTCCDCFSIISLAFYHNKLNMVSLRIFLLINFIYYFIYVNTFVGSSVKSIVLYVYSLQGKSYDI